MARAKGEKLIVDNRRARHDYQLLDRVETGMVLTGTEVKSLREGRVQVRQAYADVRDDELWLIGLHISLYDRGTSGASTIPTATASCCPPARDRLAPRAGAREGPHARADAALLQGRARQGRARARASGKEVHDKRRDISKRDADRQIERELSRRR